VGPQRAGIVRPGHRHVHQSDRSSSAAQRADHHDKRCVRRLISIPYAYYDIVSHPIFKGFDIDNFDAILRRISIYYLNFISIISEYLNNGPVSRVDVNTIVGRLFISKLLNIEE